MKGPNNNRNSAALRLEGKLEHLNGMEENLISARKAIGMKAFVAGVLSMSTTFGRI